MSTARQVHYTYQQYRAHADRSELKLEYCDGVIYAMAGGTPAHAFLSAATIRLLGNAMKGRCSVSSSDLRVRIESTDLSTYPDVSVICGAVQTSAIDELAAINPSLLVEVTSKSTEGYDRGEKLSHYKQIPSLRAVLFVSHRQRLVTVVARTPTGWSERNFRPGETVSLTDPETAFSVDELYEGITLDPA